MTDNWAMSDLSRMLDDLYDLSPDEVAPPASSAPPAAPSWASEEALDDAFGGWIPGPAEDASDAERSFLADVVDQPVVLSPVDDEWLVATEPVSLDAELADPVPVGAAALSVRRWSPSEDDILPARSSRKKRR